jgi:hypothetical protein
MKKLIFNGEEYQADKINNTGRDIIGYDAGDREVWSFRGITDMSKFSLEAGQIYDKNPYTIALEETDLGMSRVVEDLIELLITKSAISLTELPQPAQDKINERKVLRNNLNNITQ